MYYFSDVNSLNFRISYVSISPLTIILIFDVSRYSNFMMSSFLHISRNVISSWLIPVKLTESVFLSIT